MSALGPVAAIAASGMAAAETRMDVAAQNLANADSNGAKSGSPAPYRPQRADLSSTVAGGVAASVSAQFFGSEAAYDPSAPYADAQGMVASPAVDMAMQLINMQMAMRQFQASVRVFRTADATARTVLDLRT